MSDGNVDIGILEEKPNWLLHPKFFPSKIGGKPAWLDLKNIPTSKDIICKKCEEPMIFLCQVYAPYEEIDHGFHRTIFIFICRSGSCCTQNCAENLVALRCQLPRKNEFYSYNPSEEKENEVFEMDKWPKLCELCGLKGPSHCSKCKSSYYCCRKHQIIDWQNGHKEDCLESQKNGSSPNNCFVVTPAGKSLLFKEWELMIDEEDDEDVSPVNVNKEMEKLQKMMQEKKAGTLSNVSESELEEYTKSLPEDKIFNKFNKRISRHPDQVLRYDRGGKPLWITGNGDQNLTSIPNCQYCEGERQFEFQIMPQLLNFINVGIDFNSIDWGVIAVYTCKASCNNEPSYKQEFLIKQDLIN